MSGKMIIHLYYKSDSTLYFKLFREGFHAQAVNNAIASYDVGFAIFIQMMEFKNDGITAAVNMTSVTVV